MKKAPLSKMVLQEAKKFFLLCHRCEEYSIAHFLKVHFPAHSLLFTASCPFDPSFQHWLYDAVIH